jgi:hypothetical protein
MSFSDWNDLKDFVEEQFPSYIPVPSSGDVENYRLSNILSLIVEPNQPSNYSKQQPRFYWIGEEDNFLKSGMRSDSKPEVVSKMLWVSDDAGEKVNNLGGNFKKKNDRPSLTISERKYKHGDVNQWLKNLPFKGDIVKSAQEGKLWMVHDVIMAEKCDIKGQNEKPFGLCRPEDFGEFPIGFKVSKLQAHQVKPGNVQQRKVKRNKVKSVSPSYYLKLENVKYFNMPYTVRNFYENGKFNYLNERITDQLNSTQSWRSRLLTLHN